MLKFGKSLNRAIGREAFFLYFACLRESKITEQDVREEQRETNHNQGILCEKKK